MSNRQPNVIWKPGVAPVPRRSRRKKFIVSTEASGHVGSSSTTTILKSFNRDNTIPTFIELPPAPPFLRKAEAIGTLWTINKSVVVKRWSPQTITAVQNFLPFLNAEPGYNVGDVVIFNGIVKSIERSKMGPIEIDRYTFLTTNFENVMFDTSLLTRVR